MEQVGRLGFEQACIYVDLPVDSESPGCPLRGLAIVTFRTSADAEGFVLAIEGESFPGSSVQYVAEVDQVGNMKQVLHNLETSWYRRNKQISPRLNVERGLPPTWGSPYVRLCGTMVAMTDKEVLNAAIIEFSPPKRMKIDTSSNSLFVQ